MNMQMKFPILYPLRFKTTAMELIIQYVVPLGGVDSRHDPVVVFFSQSFRGCLNFH